MIIKFEELGDIIMDYSKKLRKILSLAIEKGASDIYISSGRPVIFRVDSVLTPVFSGSILKAEEAEWIISELLSREEVIKRFREIREIDFSYNFDDKARFRGNAFFQKGEMSCSLRLISNKIRTIEELKLPPALHKFSQASQGFVLITGPAGQGKSTTLASLIDEINHTRTDHIITIEDPIEYIFQDDKSIVDQKEVGSDSLSFASALRATLREDPDVIMVGEMRDIETMSTAITAAETGHLVLATLHTNSAPQTIFRIVDSFPSSQQYQIRAQLAGSLLGIVSQRLLPSLKGGLIPACEILFNNTAISNLIRLGKIYEIPVIMEISKSLGMVSLNSSLAALVRKGLISPEVALRHSLKPEELKNIIKKSAV